MVRFSWYLVLLVLKWASAYNVDVSRAQVFAGPPSAADRSSYFGFSVALYAGPTESLLLVGAPRANSSRPADRRESVNEPGAVYRCRLDGQHSCAEWLLDLVPKNLKLDKSTGLRLERDHAWLGATISIENSTTPRIAVCAPKWKVFDERYRPYWHALYMPGMCHFLVVNDSSVFENDHRDNQYFFMKKHTYNMGQVGFSAHIDPDSHQLLLGAIGFYTWIGLVLLVDHKEQPRNSFNTILPEISRNLEFDEYEYFGYSVTSGRFQEMDERLYAAGMPRRKNALGKVVVFSFPARSGVKLSIKNTLYGEQYGEYFGAGLTSCDVNADGRDELIVGAPLWSRKNDEGRVYVFSCTGQSKWKTQRLDGEQIWGRFGSAVACLGDLDQDGYKDIAIGAPYENNERGAVYVYRGGPNGIKPKPSQRISAADFTAGLRGFGAAITEPSRDIDGNGHPDIAVGAYLSGHAVFLPSRSTVRVWLKLSKPDGLMLTANSTNFKFDVCAGYHGAHEPPGFKVKVMLRLDEFHSRVLDIVNARNDALNNVTTYMQLVESKHQCTTLTVHLKEEMKNVLDSIDITGQLESGESSSCITCPVINPDSKITDDLKVFFSLDCGSDKVCYSNLDINVTSNLQPSERYIIGSKTNVNLTVCVRNIGEPAYGAQVRIFIPEPITPARVPAECSKRTGVTLEIVCDVGNPLRVNSTVVIELDMEAVEYNDDFQEIRAIVTTQSKNVNVLHNNGSFRIYYGIDADVAIVGKSEENYYSYFDNEIGKTSSKTFTFHHIYELQKAGVTSVKQAILNVKVPMLYKGERIAKINPVRGSINGQSFKCDNTTSNATTVTTVDNVYTFETNDSHVTSATEPAFYVNCTNLNVTCLMIYCNVGPFDETTSVVKLIATINLEISKNMISEINRNDLIFVSEAFVQIISPIATTTTTTTTTGIEKPNFKQISTTFMRRYSPIKVSICAIVISVLLGVIILTLISLLLYKLGFFRRVVKEDLQTAKLMNEVRV